MSFKMVIGLISTISIIILFGILGGTINYVMQKLTNPNIDKKYLIKLQIMGVGASFLVPVVLYMGDSELIKNILNFQEDKLHQYFAFAGLCLISGIYSRYFIYSIAHKLLQKYDDTKKQLEQLEEVKKGAENISNFIVLSELDDDIHKVEEETKINKDLDSLSDEEKKILNSYNENNLLFKTVEKISKTTNNSINKTTAKSGSNLPLITE